MSGVSERLLPYVPRLVVEWLADAPSTAHRRVEGTLAFCDVSGFTALTERLASGGRAGAEEMGSILNQVFTDLLVGAYDQGAALLKYGGDAVLLLFQGPAHEVRACRAAWSMQSTMAQIGELRTSVGPARLRMSVGVESGLIDFFLTRGPVRELVVSGPVATATAGLEASADAAEVLLGPSVSNNLSSACLGPHKGPGRLLVAPPGVSPFQTFPLGELPDLTVALAPAVVEHVVGGFTDGEHRVVVPGFMQLRGLDGLLAMGGPDAVAAELDAVVSALVESCARHAVTFIGTDIAPDGAKAIVVGGAPRSVDDAESRVVLALREAMATDTQLRLRAGAACGRVFAGDYGPPYRRTYSGIGDTVNLAARVMGRAGDGQLLVTEALLSTSRTPFLTAPLEPFLVKGKTEPVLAHVVEGVAEQGSVAAPTLPFVGRAGELTTLRSAAAATSAGHGGCIELLGSAGMGRTRLLEEALGEAPGIRVVTVACDAYSAVTPYAVLRRLVAATLGAEHSLAGLDAALSRAPSLAPWRPLLGALLGFDVPLTDEVAALDERFRAQRLRQVVVELLGAVLDSPTALVVDDAHLADAGSEAVLRALAQQAAHHPWLVVLSARAPESDEQVSDLVGEVLWLAPLEDQLLRDALLRATESGALAERLLDEVVARAGGNPLYAGQLLEALADGGESADLPDSLESLVAVQIDRLPPASRRLLRLAAVCGTVAERELVALVADEHITQQGGVDWERLERFLQIDESVLRFRQSVIRDAAYAGLSYAERRQLHERIGSALAAAGRSDDDSLALLSFHYFSAGIAQEALRWSEAAGDRAVARYATHEAARFYERALEAGRWQRPRPREALARLVLAASRAWFALGDLDRSGHVLRLLPEGTSVEVKAAALLSEVRLRLRTGAYTQGLRRLTTLEGLAAQLPSEKARALLAEVWAQRAYVRRMQGRAAESAQLARRAVALAEVSAEARQVESLRALALSYQSLDWALVALGESDEGAHLLRALEIYRELGDLPPQARIHNHLGIGAYYRGDWSAALSHYSQAREVFERTGDSWYASIVTGNIAEIYVEQGRLDEAAEPTRLALRAAKAAGARSFIALWTAQLGRIAIREQRVEEGLALLREARDIYCADGEAASALVVDAQIAAGLALGGEPAEALTIARTSLEQLGKVPGAAEAEPLLQRARGFSLIALGRCDEGVAAFHASLVAARARQGRRDIALGLDALIAHADAPEVQRARWVAERDQLVVSLGIARLSASAESRPTLALVPEQGDPIEAEQPILAG